MSYKKILVVRFSSLGDIILLTPIFREIKKRFPEAEIDFLTSTTFSSICQNNPHINSILQYDRNDETKERSRISDLIRQNDYDLVLDAHCSLRSRHLLYKSFGSRYWFSNKFKKIDKRSWKRNLLLKIKVNLLKEAISQREAYCRLLDSACSDHNYNLATELFPSENDHLRVNDILHQFGLDGKPLVAIGPSASFIGKSWPKERYLELADHLYKSGYHIILVGANSDSEPKWIEDNANMQIFNAAGLFNFLETAAMVEKCSLAISNDSAVVHFAEAMGTPSISIFGPTSREFGYGPFLENSQLIDIDLPCRPCSRNGKGKCHNAVQRQCLVEIPVSRVFNSALNILAKQKNTKV